MPKIMFSEKELQIWDFESFIFGFKFRFFGGGGGGEGGAEGSFRRYSQLFFCLRPTVVVDIFTQPLSP